MESAVGRLRKLLGLTQIAFAKISGVSQGHISEVERGLTDPCEKLLHFLASVRDLAGKALERYEKV